MVQLGGSKDFFFTAVFDPSVPDVRFGIEFIVVVFEKGKSSHVFCTAYRRNALQQLSKLLYLFKFPVVPVVIVEDAVPVQLGSEGSCAPAEEGNKVCSLGNGLHCPQRQLPRPWGRHFHPVYPAACAGLLFHDSEMRADAACFNQVAGPLAVVEIG